MDEVTGSLGALKEYVEKMELEVPHELKATPKRLTGFNKSISALTTQVINLEGFKLDILGDLLALPGSFTDLSSQIAKLKVLDAILDVMNKVALCLDKFDDAINSASNRVGPLDVRLTGQVVTSPAEEENMTRDAERQRNQTTVMQLFQ
ncbi:hypothetical protein Tco_1366881 [Tanacetum coccineum]